MIVIKLHLLAGIAQLERRIIIPAVSLKYGVAYSSTPNAGDAIPEELLEEMVGEAKRLEGAGAALLNFTNSGPVVGPAVAQAVSIPVVGGFGGGPWLDGRMRMATAAIGYSAEGLDDPPDTYANVAQIAFDAIAAFADDVRSARQIAGGIRQ